MCHPLRISSLSDLSCIIIQVAGTPTHGVLVSVSVSAVEYTRILVSDRIGACPYRPFSNGDHADYLQRMHSCPERHTRTRNRISETTAALIPVQC